MSSPSDLLTRAGARYHAMRTYASEGVVTSRLVRAGRELVTETAFTMRLGKPRFYLLTWTFRGFGRERSGAVWNTGQGAHLYLSHLNAYARQRDDWVALSAAHGASGGAVGELPYLFFKGKDVLTELAEARVEQVDYLRGEACYVISGASQISRRHVVWISRDRLLLLKIQRSFSRLSGPRTADAVASQMGEAHLAKAIGEIGADVTEQDKTKLRRLLTRMKRVLAAVTDIDGDITQTHTAITVNEAAPPEAFAFAPPSTARLKSVLF